MHIEACARKIGRISTLTDKGLIEMLFACRPWLCWKCVRWQACNSGHGPSNAKVKLASHLPHTHMNVALISFSSASIFLASQVISAKRCHQVCTPCTYTWIQWISVMLSQALMQWAISNRAMYSRSTVYVARVPCCLNPTPHDKIQHSLLRYCLRLKGNSSLQWFAHYIMFQIVTSVQGQMSVWYFCMWIAGEVLRASIRQR